METTTKKKGLRLIPMNEKGLKKELSKEDYKQIKEENFMLNNKIYDGVWGWIQLNSYNIEGVEGIFIYDKHLTPTNVWNGVKVEIGKTKANNPKWNVSKNTVDNSIKILKKLGLISKGKIKEDKFGNKDVDVWFIKEDFKDYELIPFETLEFLTSFTNGRSIKTYVYLLKQYKWKLKSNEGYIFTQKELNEEMGLSNNQSNNNTLKHILDGLQMVGLIDWVEFTQMNKDGKPTPYMRLTKVNLYHTKKQKEIIKKGIDLNKLQEEIVGEMSFKF